MFVERLVAGLIAPQNRLGELDDTLGVDVDQYRALLMHHARALSEAGQVAPGRFASEGVAASADWNVGPGVVSAGETAVDPGFAQEVAAWAFTCIADGWVDEHLHQVRDSLLELGAVQDQAHLDRLLRAAVLRILGIGSELSPADSLLLDTVNHPPPTAHNGDGEPLGLRLLARHYAKELGLLSRVSGRASGRTERTLLGDTALRMPRHNLPAYLLALETLQSVGAADRWRTPRRALAYLLEQREFEVPTTAQARRIMDPEGLLPWRRIRRLSLMGMCEPAAEHEEDDRHACRYRLLPYGEEALRLVLRDPPSEVVRIAEATLMEQTRQSLRPLLLRGPTAHRTDLPINLATGRPGPGPGQTLTTTMRPAIAQPHQQRASAAAPVAAHAATSLARTPVGRPAAEQDDVHVPIEISPVESSGPETMRETQAVQELELGHIVQRAWDEILVRQVSFKLLGSGVRILGDRRALMQAWRELLRSAAEAAVQGPATPNVLVELVPAGEDVVVLLHDNGPPLSAADREGMLDVSLGLLSEGCRNGLVRAHRALLAQGAAVAVVPPRLGGTSLRVLIPRAPRHQRRAA